uniref:Uncharacterized protein n=1 Tax=Entomoneis paludosa TaxID=265537 RepID=A0A7S2Y846_9STRA
MIFTNLTPTTSLLLPSTRSFDGNASWSSSFTVDNDDKKLAFEFEEEPTPRRSVRFEEAQNEYFSDNERVAEECAETWYASEDYAEFKADVQSNIQAASSSFSNTVESIYQATTKDGALTAEQESQLMTALSNNMELIGLENYVVRSIAKASRSRREFLQDVVADIIDEADEDDEVAEELRDSCYSISRVACLFSQYMAQAQQQC